MKAMVIEEFGSPSELKQVEIDKPMVQPHHVLIEVKATSVNPVDCRIRRGQALAMTSEFPAILQGDVAGIVAEVGEGVTKFKVGDEVYGLAGGTKGTAGGALADFMLADVDFLALKPRNLDMKSAAALPLVSLTAWQALVDRAQVGPNQKVLIHGAAGGVGHIAIQIAKWRGADVYSTATGEEKLSIGKSLGATMIDYKTEDVKDHVKDYTDGKGFDAVFDTVGGENLPKSFEATRPLGQVMAISTWGTYDLSILNAKGLNLRVIFCMYPLVSGIGRAHYGEILSQVTQLVEEGKINPILDSKNFTLLDAAKAHEHLESGKAIGKVVITNE